MWQRGKPSRPASENLQSAGHNQAERPIKMRQVKEKNKELNLLATPLFVFSVLLLAFNDFVLKAAFHNWLTGKISDVTGLIAFTLLGCAIWPAHRRVLGFAVSIGFMFWKSPYSQCLINIANAIFPFNIGRTVDYSDFLALPVVWLVCRYASTLRPWETQQWLIRVFAVISLIVFSATTYIPRYGISKSATLSATYDKNSLEQFEKELQIIFDNIATAHDLFCITCDSVSTGRLYSKSQTEPFELTLTVNFDAQRAVVFFDIQTRGPKASKMEHEVDIIRSEIENKLQNKYPDLKINSAKHERQQFIQLGVWKKKSNTSYLDSENRADYYKALNIIDRIMVKNRMKRAQSTHPTWVIYYTGRLFGPHASDHELIVGIDIADSPLVPITIERFTPEYAELQGTIASEVESELEAEFGKERVGQWTFWRVLSN